MPASAGFSPYLRFVVLNPDLILFDHAPTALLASRGLPTKRVTIGSGFCIPPDQHPLPNLRPWKPATPLAHRHSGFLTEHFLI